MILQFTLSMPNNNSWNGRWSGEDRFYAKVVNFGRTQRAEKHANDILDTGYYYYNFGDGWGAGIEVKGIDAGKARTVRRKSSGFCGYDWMINSIMSYGEIRSS